MSKLFIFISIFFLGKVQAQSGWPEATRSNSPEPHRATASPLIAKISYDQLLGAQIPQELPFQDEAGKKVSLGQFFGKRPLIFAFVYYECPMLCTEVLNGMVQSLKTLSLTPGKDFDILTLSIDPKETPALAAKKKASYLTSYQKCDPASWHFLTGSEQAIDSITSVCGFHAVYDSISGQYAHAAGIMIFTPEGKIARYFFGTEFAARDIEFGLIEASHNTIGSLTSQLLLYCYHYDPASGKYGAVVIRFIQLGGIATVIFILALMFFLRPRWKKRIT